MPADVHGTVDMEKVDAVVSLPPYWLAIVGGVLRMLFPTAFARIMAGIGQNTGAIIAAAFILLFLGTMFIAFWR
jgi:hypothetical protein